MENHTDEGGRYSIAGLAPGRYKVTIRMPGFRTVARVGAILEPGENLFLDFTMEMLVLHESITVTSSSEQLDPSDTGRLTLTRDSPGATLPTNGPDFQASFDLIPGIVVTPPGVGDVGRFTSNGQRPNANSFQVVGVSVNPGAGGSALPGSLPGGFASRNDRDRHYGKSCFTGNHADYGTPHIGIRSSVRRAARRRR